MSKKDYSAIDYINDYNVLRDIFFKYTEAAFGRKNVRQGFEPVADDVIGSRNKNQIFYHNKEELLNALSLTAYEVACPDEKVSLTYGKIDIQIPTPSTACISAELCVLDKNGCAECLLVTAIAKKNDKSWILSMISESPLNYLRQHLADFTEPLNEREPFFKYLLDSCALEFITESISAGIICTYDREGFPLCYADDKLIETLGYERDEFENKFKKGTGALNYSDDRNKVREIAESVSNAEMFNIRTRWVKKDGSPLWVEFYTKKISDGYGNTIFFSVVTNASELAEYKVRADEQAVSIKLSEVFASKMQKYMLPDEKSFENCFSDSSIVWKPRNTVGGDMFFMRKFPHGSVLCVFDCTGHGVTGALHSALVCAMLHDIIVENNCAAPSRIIHELDIRLANANRLFDKDDFEMAGNCAIAALFIDNEGGVFASSSDIRVFICNGNEVNQIKGQRLYIGEGKIKSIGDVKTTIIDANPNNKYYIATDGLFDQICGHKPFGYKRFKQIILEHHNEKLSAITDRIFNSFESLRAENYQRDDLEIISFRP